MVISEKAYTIAASLRGARGGIDDDHVFPLADAISDVMWKTFSHKWDPRHADVTEALNGLENIILRGWRIAPEKIAKAMSLVREAITNGYDWHTPMSETVDRRSRVPYPHQP